jgi:hypothetical protein
MDKGMNSPENNLITVFTAKEITSLYKLFLEIIEDLEADNRAMLGKIAEKTSPQVAADINYFTREKYEQIRKRVLDNGNETSRKLLSFLDFFEFTINAQKVEDAAKLKRSIVKKIIISSPISVE